MKWSRAKQDISESDLIAYHLHELSPRRERRVARALAASAALAAESSAVEAALRAVKDRPQPIEQAAFTRTWEALRPALMPHRKPVAVTPRRRGPLLTAAGLAGLAAIGIWLDTKAHKQAPPTPTSVPEQPAVAAPRSVTSQAGQPDTGGRLTQVPATGFHGTLKTGLYHPDAHRRDTPPLHLLALAPNSGGRQTTPEESPRTLQTGVPTPLTTQPVPPDVAAGTVSGGKVSGGKVWAGKVDPDLRAAAGSGAAQVSAQPRPVHPSDLMLGVGGTFIAPHSSLTAGTELRTQTATHAIAAVGAFHQQVRPALGYRVTLSYTRPEFDYTYYGSGGGINSSIFEAAGTYVVQGPHHGRLSTAIDAGGALLAFLPDRANPHVSYVYRAAGVLGASADYALTTHWAARATYRAQVFRGPDFRYNGGTIPVTTSVVVNNEPSVGIVYRFGKMDATAKP